MKDELRNKLIELQLQKKLMSMNKDATEEDLININAMIRQVEKEYAKVMIEEENKNGKNR